MPVSTTPNPATFLKIAIFKPLPPLLSSRPAGSYPSYRHGKVANGIGSFPPMWLICDRPPGRSLCWGKGRAATRA